MLKLLLGSMALLSGSSKMIPLRRGEGSLNYLSSTYTREQGSREGARGCLRQRTTGRLARPSC